MSIWQWFQANTVVIVAVLLLVYLLERKRIPSIGAWQAFLNSFETKGGQLALLWVTDCIFLACMVHYWTKFDAPLQNFFVGLISGVNGAFLGAIGARYAGGPPLNPNAPKLDVSFVPGTPPSDSNVSVNLTEKKKDGETQIHG